MGEIELDIVKSVANLLLEGTNILEYLELTPEENKVVKFAGKGLKTLAEVEKRKPKVGNYGIDTLSELATRLIWRAHIIGYLINSMRRVEGRAVMDFYEEARQYARRVRDGQEANDTEFQNREQSVSTSAETSPDSGGTTLRRGRSAKRSKDPEVDDTSQG